MPAIKSNPSTELKVQEYLSSVPESSGEILQTLSAIILETDPRIIEEIKWGNPAYSYLGIMIYLRAFKEHATLGFFRGNEVADPEGRLEGHENPVMRSIKYRSPEEIDAEVVREYVSRAMKANERKAKS